jgi:major vault protein
MLNGEIFMNNVLKDDEALLVQAKTEINIDGKVRMACERWMEYGPCNYVPPIGVEIIEQRQKIALDKNEGIYVRDIKSGSIRTVIG